MNKEILLRRIFDCSNSQERPSNRNFGGPIENEFVSLLKKYSWRYGYEFVFDVNNADIIFTNDIYPSYIKDIQLPKIKRMDGVFWKNDLKERNEKYNQAAIESDHVIFISHYSKKSYEILYGNPLKNFSVVHHWVEKKFDYKNENQFNSIFFSMATNWNREEKRLNELIKFSENIPCKIYLIGTCEKQLPENIISVGYLETDSLEFLNVIKKCCGFLNLTYKDAATKTVCEALNYNIPVLYSSSGGVKELARNFGTIIYEEDSIKFQESVSELNLSEMIFKHNIFKDNYKNIMNHVSTHDFTKDLENSLTGYFGIFSKY